MSSLAILQSLKESILTPNVKSAGGPPFGFSKGGDRCCLHLKLVPYISHDVAQCSFPLPSLELENCPPASC